LLADELARTRKRVTKRVLVEVDVSVTSGLTKLKTVDVHVGTVMYATSVVDPKFVLSRGWTKTDVVAVTIEAPELGEIPLTHSVLPAELTV
jgi:hypothetical protein